MEDQVPQSEHGIPQQLQNAASNYSNMRRATASPPVPNGVTFHRQQTPQPHIGSRPPSRNNIRRTSSTLGPPPHQQATQAPPGPNGYAYIPNPPVFNHPAHPMPVPSHLGPGQHPQYYPQPPPHHPHIQQHQAYRHDQRPSSVPPSFSQQEAQQPPSMSSPPQRKQEPQRPQENQPNRIPKPNPANRSIFTPIDDSRSLLAQHWGIASTTTEPRSNDVKIEKDVRRVDLKTERAQSVDLTNTHRTKPSGPTPPPPRPQRGSVPQRTQTSSAPGEIQPPSRTNSAQQGVKRPRLKVQIPSEQSDGGSATAESESSPRQSAGTAGGTPAKASTDASHSSGVVLPPPSPSAGAILSAGAQGPRNPFARPHPPMVNAAQTSQPYGNNNIETPISALPSRFVADGLIPSPSSFYPEWGFGRSGVEGNMLPSPLNFQTPVMSTGPSFLRDEDGERKRKSPEGDANEQAALKRLKT